MSDSADDERNQAREARLSAARYRTLAEASDLAVWRTNALGALVSDMPGWRDVTGQGAEDLAGDGWLTSVPESDRERVRAAWRHSVATGDTYDIEYPIAAADGSLRLVRARGLPLVEDGAIVEWIGTVTDITELRDSLAELLEEKAAVETLREIGTSLSAELELSRLVDALTEATTRLTGAQFGAFFYTSRSKDGEEFLLHTLSGMTQEEFGQFPSPRNTAIFAPTFAGEAPVRLDDVTAAARFGKNKPFYGMPQGHPPVRSFLAVPVVSRSGKVHGGLFFGHGAIGRFTQRHEQLVVGVAAQAAVALDNAALYDAERQARAAAEEAQYQLALLASVSHRMAMTLDAEDAARTLVQACVPQLADWCGVFVRQSSQEVTLLADGHVDPDRAAPLAEALRRWPVRLDAPYGAGAVLRTGEPSMVPAISDEQRGAFAADEEQLALLSAQPAHSVLSVPLEARGRVIGALSLRREGCAAFEESDVSLVQELARRGGVAIDNAMTYDRERSAALMLQRSLLPRIVPRLDSATCATRYLPGAAGAAAGGDWYDVLALDRGVVAIAVGDVQGRGVVAASVMGQLRSAVRAYALEHHSPAEVVARTDRVVLSLDDAPLATCVFARYDPSTRILTLANAGHLPPLVLDSSGARFLDLDPGLPLGVGGGEFLERAVLLEEGSAVLLFTDGLVEGPSVSLESGLRQLSETADDAFRRGLGPDDLADAVLAGMVGDEGLDDDIALLVFSTVGPVVDRTIELAGDPAAVRTARRLAEEAADGMGDTLVSTLGLLVSEVVTNAVRHTGSAVRFRVRATARRVRVEVFDDRRATIDVRPAAADDLLQEEGRGLRLLDQLAEQWGVEPTSGGKCVWFELSEEGTEP